MPRVCECEGVPSPRERDRERQTDIPSNMSRTEEVNTLTERVYKVVMDQFNPTLRNFVTMAKNYEKALTGVTLAAKGYFDSLVKLGELASDSQGSKELGDTLFQMAEVHRQIQVQTEETLNVFHSELITHLEQKLELDVKYLNSALKKYQLEIRGKAQSIDKCHSELKKLRRKSQMSKNPQKYGDREMQFVEMISRKQCEMDMLVAEGYTSALVEERRRYCFLVDRQCAVSKQFSLYHVKVKDLLSHKLVSWQKSCSDPGRIPERAMALVKQTATSSTGPLISQPSPAVKPLDSMPELAPMVGGNGLSLSHRSSLPILRPVPNGETEKACAMEEVPPRSSKDHTPAHDSSPILPPPPKAKDTSSSTFPSSKKAGENHRAPSSGEHRTLPRPPATLCVERPRVRAVFSHAACESGTLLSFQANDIITLLVPEAKDGWHYGESEVTGRKGWFPFSYTRPLQDGSSDRRSHSNLQASKFNSSSTGRLDKVGVSLESGPAPSSRKGNSSLPSTSNLRPRPFSMMNPDLSQLGADFGKPGGHSPRPNPFANVRLKRTVTNDRSAPAIR